jgi:tetratricopeptide (TPR) repeat protein
MAKYAEAREGYQKILATKDLNLAAKAHFNIGNTFFMEDKLTESIESYKKALEISPDDFDAKYNLELARAKLKEQSEKQQQNPDQNKQNQDQQNQQNQDQQQNQDENQQQAGQDQQEQNQQDQQEQNQQEEQAQQAQAREDKINKDEAERLLNAVESDEQEAQKRKAPVPADRRRAVKDW